MNHSSVRLHRVFRSLRVVPFALVLAGVIGLTAVATQVTPTQEAHAASWLRYQRGYYLDNGWLCYGWSNGAYHCTHHWHRAGGRLVSDNHAWVPNYGSSASASVTHSSATHSAVVRTQAPVSHPAPAPVSGGQGVVGEIQAVFGPNAGAALAVARCESSYNPNALNASSGASGVFQFLPSTWRTTSYAGYSPFNASANIHAAYQVFTRDGYSWREWQCQP